MKTCIIHLGWRFSKPWCLHFFKWYYRNYIDVAFNKLCCTIFNVIGEGVLNSLSFLLTSHCIIIVLHFVYFEAEHAYAQLIANRYSEVLWQAWWQYVFYFSFTKVTIVMYNWTNRLQKCLGYFAHRSWLLVSINWTYLILQINILSNDGYIWFILYSKQLHTSNLLKTIALGLLFL